MQSITYSTKSALYSNQDIPDTNKCNATDMNEIKTVVNGNATECGNATSLTTSSKTSLVSAINEVNSKEGDLTSLSTSAKSDLVNAVNELYDMFYYKSGDTITFLYVSLAGFITSSTKEVTFTVYLPKSLSNITSLSVSSFNAELRGTEGYLNSSSGYTQYVGLSGYTINASASGDNSINIRLAKSTAFTNVPNNTPVTASAVITINLS